MSDQATPQHKFWDEIARDLSLISGCEKVVCNPSYATHFQPHHFIHFNDKCHMCDSIGEMYAYARYLGDKREETETVIPVVDERELGGEA